MKHAQRAGIQRSHTTHAPPQAARPAARRDTTWGRLRYRLDNALSRGPFMVIGWLAGATAAIILLSALVLELVHARINDAHVGFVEGLWQSMLRVVDPGTMSADNGWALRATALLVTIAGIFLASALIGLIAAAIDRQIEHLRRGRSAVLEHDHTLVLGWSPRISTVLSELCVANENVARARIVVLADRDKVDMENDLQTHVPSRGTTRIICRSGDPANLDDLDIVRPEAARSIVVLGDVESSAGDATIVKSVLAVLARTPGLDIPIVAEIWDAEIGDALRRAGHGRVRCVRSSDVIARITAQACRQAGLSAVCQELLDFDGDEIYFAQVPELDGHTFAESLVAFEAATVIGVRSADGTVTLSPPMDRIWDADDQVIAVCEDDDRVIFSGFPTNTNGTHPPPDLPSPDPETILVTGWNAHAPVILQELDAFAVPGTHVDLLVDQDLVGDDTVATAVEALHLAQLDIALTVTRVDFDALAAQVDGTRYDHVVVLGYRGTLSPAEADARTMLTMLLLQQQGTGQGFGRVVAEILDSRDLDLAQVTGADDFVVSDGLSALMLAQLAENPELEGVFTDLFDADGAALMVRPSDRYLAPGLALAWHDVVRTVATSGDIAIGYVGGDTGGVPVINPANSASVRFDVGDQIVVIATHGRHEGAGQTAARNAARIAPRETVTA